MGCIAGDAGVVEDRVAAQSYYPYSLRLDDNEWWLLWYSNDTDGLWVDEEGSIPAFDSLSALERFADSKGIELGLDKGDMLDLPLIERWLHDPRPRQIECNAFLGAWNLFSDVARSIGSELPDGSDLANKCYDKLFWGNNLPAVTPPGKHYEPIWDAVEADYLRTLLGSGLTLLRSRLTDIER